MKVTIAAAAAAAGLGLCLIPSAVSADMRQYSGARVCTAEGCQDYQLVEAPTLTLLPRNFGRDVADTACLPVNLVLPEDAHDLEELDAEICTATWEHRSTSTLIRIGDIWLGAESVTAPGGVTSDSAVGARAGGTSLWLVDCSYDPEVATSCR